VQCVPHRSAAWPSESRQEKQAAVPGFGDPCGPACPTSDPATTGPSWPQRSSTSSPAAGVTVDFAATRRNVPTRGSDVNALVGRTFRIGDALCEGRRLYEPLRPPEPAQRPIGLTTRRYGDGPRGRRLSNVAHVRHVAANWLPHYGASMLTHLR
jgi:hypothetical protein